MAMALQIMAVIILFGYPGCSSDKNAGVISPAKTSAVTDSSHTIKSSFGKYSTGYLTQVMLKQKEEK